MEKKSTLVGMPLLAIKEGAECGNVTQLIVDAAAKRVTHLVLGRSKGLLGYNKAVPVEKIVGVGRDYITVLTVDDLVSVWDLGSELPLCLRDDELVGLTVISSLGNVEGAVGDFAIDTGNGTIEEVYMEDGVAIAHDRLLTIALKGLFVNFNSEPVAKADAPVQLQVQAQPETTMEAPVESAAEAAEVFEATFANEVVAQPAPAPVEETPVAAEAAPVIEAPVAVVEEAPAPVIEAAAPIVEEPAVEVPAPVEEAPAAVEAPVAQAAALPETDDDDEEDEGTLDDEMDYFVRRQSEFLLGRTVTKDILAPDGTVLVQAGKKVTANVIKRVKNAGKLTELSLNA